MEIFIDKDLQHFHCQIKKNFPKCTIKKTSVTNWKKLTSLAPDLFIFSRQMSNFSSQLPPDSIGIATFFLEEDVEWFQSSIADDFLIQKIKYKQSIWEQNRMVKHLQSNSIYLQELATIGKISLDLMHEINNPLQIILGFTENIMETMNAKSAYYEDLKIIEEEIARCIHTIKKARGFDGYLEQTTCQDISFVLNSIAELASLALRKKKIQLYIKIPQNLNFVTGQNKLYIILLSILIQTIDISLEKESILISAREEFDHINISIENSNFNFDVFVKKINHLRFYLAESNVFFEYIQEKEKIIYLLKLWK